MAGKVIVIPRLTNFNSPPLSPHFLPWIGLLLLIDLLRLAETCRFDGSLANQPRSSLCLKLRPHSRVTLRAELPVVVPGDFPLRRIKTESFGQDVSAL